MDMPDILRTKDATELQSQRLTSYIRGDSKKHLNLTLMCMASYNSHIVVPGTLTLKEVVSYANEHFDEIPLGPLTYVRDVDTLTVIDCEFDS